MDIQRAIRLDAAATAAAYPMDKIFLRLTALPAVDQLAVFEENGALIHIAADHDKSISEAFDRNRLARAWRPILLCNMQVDGDIENNDAGHHSNYSLLDTFLDEPVSNVAYYVRAFLPKYVADVSIKVLNASNKLVKVISSFGLFPRFALADVAQGFTRSSGAFRFLVWSSDANYKLAYGDRHDRVFMHFFTPDCSFDKILSHNKQRNVISFAFHPVLDSFVAVCCENAVILWRLDFTQPTAADGKNKRQGRRQIQQAAAQQVQQRSVRAIVHKQLTNGQAKPFTSVCFSCEGTMVFACSPSYGVHVWDFATGALVRVVNNLLQPIEIITCPDGLLNGFRSLYPLMYVGDQFESLNYCAVPSLYHKRITSSTWYAYGPTLFVTLEKDPFLYTLDFSAPAQWRNRYEILIQSTETMLNPIADFEAVHFGDGRCVGGCPKKIVFDLTGRRMALMLEPLKPALDLNSNADTTLKNGANYVWLFDVRINSQFCSIEFNPIGGISSPMGAEFDDYPQLMSMKNNFETGALLTIGWKSGAISHLPMAFDGCEQNMWREFQEHPNVVMRSAPLAGSGTQLLANMLRTSSNLNSVMPSSRAAPSGTGMSSAATATSSDAAGRQSPTFLRDPRQSPLSSNEQPPPTSQPQHANPFINRMNIHPQQQQPPLSQQPGISPLSSVNRTMPPQWNKTSLLNNSPLSPAFLANATATMCLSASSSPSTGTKAASEAAQEFPQNSFNPFQMLPMFQRQPYANAHSGTISPSITTNANPFASGSSPTFQFLPASFAVSSPDNQRSSPMSISPTLQQHGDVDTARAGSAFDNNYSPISARLKRPLRHSPLTTTLTMRNRQQSPATGDANTNFMQPSGGGNAPFGASSSTPLQHQLLMRQRLAGTDAGNNFAGFGRSYLPARSNSDGFMGSSNMTNISSSVNSSTIGTPLAMSTPLDSAQNLPNDSDIGDRSLLNFGRQRLA